MFGYIACTQRSFSNASNWMKYVTFFMLVMWKNYGPAKLTGDGTTTTATADALIQRINKT